MSTDFEEPSAALFHSASQGDERSISTLIAKYHDMARLHARRAMTPEQRAFESASDIVQSAMRKYVVQLPGSPPETESAFRRNLLRVVKDKVFDHLRYQHAKKRDVNRNVEPVELYSFEPSPISKLVASESIEEVERALDSIPEEDATVFRFRKFMGMDLREISDELGIDVEESKRRVARANERFWREFRKGL